MKLTSNYYAWLAATGTKTDKNRFGYFTFGNLLILAGSFFGAMLVTGLPQGRPWLPGPLSIIVFAVSMAAFAILFSWLRWLIRRSLQKNKVQEKNRNIENQE